MTGIVGHPSSLVKALRDLLLKANANERDIHVLFEARGLAGQPPKSLRELSFGISHERGRQLLHRLESGPLQAVIADQSDQAAEFRKAIEDSLQVIEAIAPATEDSISASLAQNFTPLDLSPASIVRVANLLGISHNLEVAIWKGRSKFADKEKQILATCKTPEKSEAVTAVVPLSAPNVCQHFLHFARKFSRSSGVLAAGHVAAAYGIKFGVPITQHEAAAYLAPFAVHLGRHDGDDWFAFFNSRNEFLRKAATRIDLFGKGSFSQLKRFHERSNKCLYRGDVSFPDAPLKVALELAGFILSGDEIHSSKAVEKHGIKEESSIKRQMVDIYRHLVETRNGATAIQRGDLVKAMVDAGIREATARIYVDRVGIFSCVNGMCRLADAAETQETLAECRRLGRGRGRPPSRKSEERQTAT